jgi:hypothetical protein
MGSPVFHFISNIFETAFEEEAIGTSFMDIKFCG